MSAEITKRSRQDIKGKFTGPDIYPVCPMARLGRSLPSGQSDALIDWPYTSGVLVTCTVDILVINLESKENK